MPDNKILEEMASAFAAGCMDKKNYLQFREYLESGGEMPEGMLADMQYAVSLLPLTLKEKSPSPAHKSEVAKKLKSVHLQILKEKSRTTEREEVKPADSGPVSEEAGLSPEIRERLNKPERPAPGAEEKEAENKRLASKDNGRKTFEPSETVQQRRTSIAHVNTRELSARNYKYIYILTLALFITLLIIFYYFNDVKNEEIKTLETEVSELKETVEANAGFRTNYLQILEFFQNSDLEIYDLTSTGILAGVSGRLIISFDENRALLQAGSLPEFNNSEYVLWLRTQDATYQAGSFLPKLGQSFFISGSLPEISRNDLQMIMLTRENSANVERPAGDIILRYEVRP